MHGSNVRLDEKVNLKEVARITSGFVGADLANLVNEAALLAARAGKPTVTMQEFNEGVDRIVAGLEKRQRIMHADEKRRVAYHESAHALVAASLPNTDPVHKVSIIPRGLAALGYTMHRPEGDRYLVTQSELESRIQCLLAGTVAEEVVFGDVSTGAQNDLERATDIARSMVMDFGMSRLGRVTYRQSRHTMMLDSQEGLVGGRAHSEQTAREIDEEIRRIVAQSLERVRYVLETRRQALGAIADCLIEQETIDNADLKRIMEANSPSPMIVPGTEGAASRGRRPKRPLPARPAPKGPGSAGRGGRRQYPLPRLQKEGSRRGAETRRREKCTRKPAYRLDFGNALIRTGMTRGERSRRSLTPQRRSLRLRVSARVSFLARRNVVLCRPYPSCQA